MCRLKNEKCYQWMQLAKKDKQISCQVVDENQWNIAEYIEMYNDIGVTMIYVC